MYSAFHRPVILSVDKGQIEHCTADFVLATLTETMNQSSASSTNDGTTTANDRTPVPPESDLDTGTASSSHAAPSSRPVTKLSNSVASSSVTVNSPNKIKRRMSHRRNSGGAGLREPERATQQADLMDGLFDLENADEVMQLESNAAPAGSQWFSHQGTFT